MISDHLTTQVVEENGITSTHGQKSATQESYTQTRDLSFTCQDEKKLLAFLSGENNRNSIWMRVENRGRWKVEVTV